MAITSAQCSKGGKGYFIFHDVPYINRVVFSVLFFYHVVLWILLKHENLAITGRFTVYDNLHVRLSRKSYDVTYRM